MAFIKCAKRLSRTPDLWFQVDDEDVARVTAYRWWFVSHYVWTRINGRQVSLGRFILDLTDPQIFADHINGDTLDNRKDNLRLATNSQNQANRRRLPTNTSGFRGVTWHKKAGKWQAAIEVNGRNYYLGLHETAQAASVAYESAAHQHFGEFAFLWAAP